VRSLADTAAAGWPLLAGALVALAGDRVRTGRRRTALNRALHELRRPLQALALTSPPWTVGANPAPLDLAIAALADLDREINGGGRVQRLQALAPRPLIAAATERWRARAAMIGGAIELRWRAGPGLLLADPARLSQALDNLIVNALDHGGPRITVETGIHSGRLRIAVIDNGRQGRPAGRSGAPAEVIAQLLGGRHRGHGLDVVRQVAVQHGGRFALHRSESGSVAMLELPLAPDADSLAA
jgi:signal transduction histidine kinase